VGTRAANGQPINNYLINPNLERQDNQFDVKVDHALSTNNRLFARYSFQKSHRFVPGSLPHGDSGANPSGFGSAGTGDVTAQSLTINDTHTFGAGWLNEFRIGWATIEILAEPIDFGLNLANQVGIAGINLDQNSSAFTQLQFQNIRNMGATGNQPLVTTMPSLQFLDNVTHIRGRHAFKGGLSVLFRKRDVFQADSIVGVANFNNNLTSNCAGSATPCTINSSTGFDVASFLLGYASSFNRTSYEDLYTEKKPELSAYIQDDFRVSSKLTLNLGLRWDLFVPYVEERDRQSNFDTSTGRFVPASDDAVINGIKVGRYLQTYSKTDFGPRLGFAYDVTGNGKIVVRGGFGIFWNNPLTGTSSTKAQNPPFLLSNARSTSLLPTIRLSEGLPALPPVDPNRVPQGTTRSTFDPNYRDGRSMQWNVNVQRQFGRHYMAEVAYVGSAGRDLQAKTDVNQAPPTLGVTNPNVNRPFFKVAPALTNVYQSTNLGELDYHALQVKFVRRFANNFSFFNAYTFGKAIDLNSDTDGTSSFTNVYDIGYNRGPADYDITHTFASNFIYELPFARNSKLGGWQVSGLVFVRSGYPFTVTQSHGLLSTGTGNRPNRIGNGTLDNPTIDRWFDLGAFATTTENTATYGDAGRNILRGPGQFQVDASLIKVTRVGRVETEFRVEAFNLLNHPAFALPNSAIGNSAAGTISALLPGTPMRQIQFGLKVKF